MRRLPKANARERVLPEDLRRRYLPRPYLRDEMGAVLAAADLVVGRAGASSISEPLAFGTPLVLVPFGAAMEGHQEANARAAMETGAAVVVQIVLVQEFAASVRGDTGDHEWRSTPDAGVLELRRSGGRRPVLPGDVGAAEVRRRRRRLRAGRRPAERPHAGPGA